MADETSLETKPEPSRKPRGPVLLEAVFAAAQVVTSVTGATVLAVSLLTGTPLATAVIQALLATATLGAVTWTLHWVVTHGLLNARKAELEAERSGSDGVGMNVEVQA